MPFITVQEIRSINLPSGVVVAKTRTGRIRVLPRKDLKKNRMEKEYTIDGDFATLCEQGVIRGVSELPAQMLPFYPEDKPKEATP